MDIDNMHTAAGPAAGFFFQLERALVRLAEAGPGHAIGMETSDDVAVRSDSVEVREQNKHSISDRVPFGDRSRDLWRTLQIWIDTTSEETVLVEDVSLFMVTNARVSTKSLAREIADATTQPQITKVVAKLRAIGSELPEGVRSVAEAVLDYDDSELAVLIGRIHLIDSADAVLDPRAREILSARLFLLDAPVDEIVQHLLGWVLDRCMDAWRAGHPAWIHWESFARQVNRLRMIYTSKLVIRATASVPVDSFDFDTHRDRLFVQQLMLLEPDGEDELLLEAVQDFVRARTELARMAQAGDVTKADVEDFLARLQRRWANVARRHRTGLVRDASDYEDSARRAGFLVFTECADHKEQLAGCNVDQPYMICGQYHHLADIPQIGWHPDYKSLLRTKAS